MNIMRSTKVGFIVLMISIVLIGASPCMVLAESEGVREVKKEENFVKAINTVWKYKVENGKLYKRLWDETNNKWLTDWILVG